MRRLLIAAATVLALTGGSRAQLPPLIDRELFFGNPEISGAQISPDGRQIAFLKPFHGVVNIWIKERAEPFEKARPLTADTARPIRTYFWSRDSRFILYAQDKGGDENYRIYAVDPRSSGDPVPRARDLTPMGKIRAEIIEVPHNRPNEIIIGLNDRRADLHDVYRLNLTSGERKLLWKNDQNVVGWTTDLDGNLRLGVRQTPDGGTEILRAGPDSLVPIYNVGPDEDCGPERLTADGTKFYLTTNKGRDKIELELFDLSGGTTRLVEGDPEHQVDLGHVLFSDSTGELLATFYEGEQMRVYPRQTRFAKDWASLTKALPPGEISIVNMTADELLWMVAEYSDTDPGSRYLFDRTTGKAELLYHARPNLPSEHLAPMKAVRYQARDGLSIPAYLVAPKGVPAKNLPTVMYIHGGPWARVAWGYEPLAQFLANRGYAVLVPNFRGSTGYGKKFLNAGNKQWGTGSMQHDISDGVKYAVTQGIADPKRVAIFGGSYGGYATLAGLAFTPGLYAAGISYVGPSNIITLLNAIPPYWAPLKKLFAIRVGDLDDPGDRKMLEAQSPLNSATRIQAPLLVIQGANDPRVHKSESDQIVVALRDLGRPVEYLVAPDEGHGFAGELNRLAVYAAMERFLAKHLGGRYQESMTPEVKQRLEKLTMDVRTVSAPQAKEEARTSLKPPVFNPALVHPDTVRYTQTMTMMGREVTVNTTRTISPARRGPTAIWRVIDRVSGPMGEGTDTLDLDAATLMPLRRTGKQGPGSVNLTFAADGVKGTISSGAMTMPVDIKFPGLTLPDGAGIEIPLATLPLKEGFKASLGVYEMMAGKSRPMVLAVTGTEKMSVAGTTVEAYKVELTSAEDPSGDETYWIAREGRRLVKSEAKLPPSMGGGIVVSQMVGR